MSDFFIFEIKCAKTDKIFNFLKDRFFVTSGAMDIIFGVFSKTNKSLIYQLINHISKSLQFSYKPQQGHFTNCFCCERINSCWQNNQSQKHNRLFCNLTITLIYFRTTLSYFTLQKKMKPFIKNLFSKCDQIFRKLFVQCY